MYPSPNVETHGVRLYERFSHILESYHRPDIPAETFAFAEITFKTGVEFNTSERCAQSKFSECGSAAY
jgi:hypothetical protein